jgi:hypothetical protein
MRINNINLQTGWAEFKPPHPGDRQVRKCPREGMSFVIKPPILSRPPPPPPTGFTLICALNYIKIYCEIYFQWCEIIIIPLLYIIHSTIKPFFLHKRNVELTLLTHFLSRRLHEVSIRRIQLLLV